MNFNEDGHISQNVYIKEEGRREFQDFFRILSEFTAEYTPYGRIINEEKPSIVDKSLYPPRK